MLCVCLLMLITWSEAGAILNGYPVTFSLSGTTTFMPDAGGATQSGYTINLGYVGSSWIAA
jgi:hypothetical protein